MRWMLTILALVALPLTQAFAQARNHSFKDFPVKRIYAGKSAYPQFKGRDKKYAEFRTRIREGVKKGPNFGGTYSIVEIGCGTGCLFAFVANNRTGEVFDFPLGGENNYQMQLLYKLDSTLIVAQWMDTESSQCVLEFLVFNDSDYEMLGRFALGNDKKCFEDVSGNFANAN